MTLKNNKDDDESYPMARGAKFDYVGGSDTKRDELTKSIRRRMIIHGVFLVIIFTYLVLLTVWLYPTFPMFQKNNEIEKLHSDLSALKLSTINIVNEQNQTLTNEAQWSEQIDVLLEQNKQQRQTYIETVNTVAELSRFITNLNQTLQNEIANLKKELNTEKQRTEKLKRTSAMMRSEMEETISNSKAKNKNLTTRMEEQEDELLRVVNSSRTMNKTRAAVRNLYKVMIPKLKIYCETINNQTMKNTEQLFADNFIEIASDLKNMSKKVGRIGSFQNYAIQSISRLSNEVANVTAELGMLDNKIKLTQLESDNKLRKRTEKIKDNVEKVIANVTDLANTLDVHNNSIRNLNNEMEELRRVKSSMTQLDAIVSGQRQLYQDIAQNVRNHTSNIKIIEGELSRLKKCCGYQDPPVQELGPRKSSRAVSFKPANAMSSDEGADTETEDSNKVEQSSQLTDESRFMNESCDYTVYKITRKIITIRETIVNKKVINTFTSMAPAQVSWYSDRQSSSGSGYIADTSSVSASSSGGKSDMKRSASNTTSDHSEEFLIPEFPSMSRSSSLKSNESSESTKAASDEKKADIIRESPVISSNISVEAKIKNSNIATPEEFASNTIRLGATMARSTPVEDSVALRKQKVSPNVAIPEGIPVFARDGLDGYYYPGKVFSKDDSSAGKYTVLFEDEGSCRSIRETDILKINLLPVGLDVYVQSQSDSDDSAHWYVKGTISGYSKKNNEKCYLVKKNDDCTNQCHTESYLRKQVIIKQENLPPAYKKQCLKPIENTSVSDITLGNLMEGKRIRKSVKASPLAKTFSPSKPLSPRTPPTGRKRNWKSRSDDSSSSSSLCLPRMSKKRKRSKLFHEQKEPPKLILPTNTTIFVGCGFLLTASQDHNISNSSSDDDSIVDVEYSRENIRKQIIAGGGIVANDFPHLMTCASNLYVISDKCCRTLTYLSALASCIPCISFKWIHFSCTSNQLQPHSSYSLCAGYSIVEDKFVERPTSPIQPLSGLKLSLMLKDMEAWESILTLAGCNIISTPSNILSQKDIQLSCEILIADSTCPNSIIQRAKLLAIPVVSSEWAVQCLINSWQLVFTVRPEFKHDFVA